MIRLLLRSSLAHRSETHSPIWSGSKGHSLKARESKTPAVQSRDSIDPHAKESVRARLIERNHAWIDLDKLQEKILVAHPRELVLLFVKRARTDKLSRMSYKD